jgi:preprotein translocase subunit SecG
MAYTLLTIVHVLVCLFLIVVVLLQSGKAADLAGAFGGMGSQTAFGPRGSATLLSKATTGSAILFMVTSLSLSILATRNAGVGSTILDKHPAPASAKQPATTPGAPAPGAPGAPQPSVTLTDPQTGKKTTVPLNIPPPPQQEPAKK